jgi:adenylyltransferase/sulfurtransferase
LAGFGPEAQAKLRSARVLVIGAGGLGCPVLLYLAAVGVGRITIVDTDRVDVSNLQRQVLYTTDDAGALKSEAAARRLRALNPLIEIVPRAERFSRANALALVRDADVVVDGSDNFATRYLANDACVLADRPLVYGAIHGFEGQVSVFNWRGGPTYRCLFPEPPEPGSVPNCAEAGVLGVLPGVVGAIQASEAIKVLAGIGEPLSGRLWLWNALSMTTQVLRFKTDPRSRERRELPPEGYGETCALPSTTTADEIAADELRAALVSDTPPQLLDVREVWERAVGALTPSIHVPLGQLETSEATPPLATLDPQQPTVVYCAGGARSLRALPVLRERHGFRAVRSLRGGFKGWS